MISEARYYKDILDNIKTLAEGMAKSMWAKHLTPTMAAELMEKTERMQVEVIRMYLELSGTRDKVPIRSTLWEEPRFGKKKKRLDSF